MGHQGIETGSLKIKMVSLHSKKVDLTGEEEGHIKNLENPSKTGS